MASRGAQIFYIARQALVTDSLGGKRPGYAASKTAVSGFLCRESGEGERGESGFVRGGGAVLLLPPTADIRELDGVFTSVSSALPAFTVRRVKRFSLHKEAVLEECGSES